MVKTQISKRFSIEQCRTNPTTLFVFGDNLERYGESGQAIIRRQKNAIGLVTKKKPENSYDSYFTDEEYTQNCSLIEGDLERIKEYSKDYKYIAFAQFGVGTGLSDMPRKCPLTFCYLTIRLIEEFRFNNIQFLKSKL